MAYDEELAARVRTAAAKQHLDLTERKMFGGLAFMLDGHMTVGVLGTDLMVRLGADGARDALHEPHVREMDFTGRPMKGMVFVEKAGTRGAQLARWLAEAAEHVRTLPPKTPE